MQIVVPAAGRGKRFLDAGYVVPKPLIEVMGKPLIQWSLSGIMTQEPLRFIFLVLQEHIASHGIDDRLRALYPGCTIVPVDHVTEGAACTVLLAKEALQMDEAMAIVNCDNIFLIDLDAARRELSPDAQALLFYFASRHDRWSYVQTDGHSRALRVAEKEVISDKATVGCYYFSQARFFVDAAEYMIQHDLRTKGEFYVSPVFNVLIDRGELVETYPCELHYSVGTPEEIAWFTSFLGVAEPVRAEQLSMK